MSKPSFADDWELHKHDLTLWRRFWALWELRRKWNWADWFYQKLDRANGQIVETESWSLWPGPGYMKLCLWIAFLRSVHEGLTEKLEPFGTPKNQRVSVSQVLPPIPQNIGTFPEIKGNPFRDFRNAIFHCQWAPTLAKFKLDETTTRKIETLHREIGDWLNKEFRSCFSEFKKKYATPPNWIYDSQGNELFPEGFY